MNCVDNSHDHRGHGPYRVTTRGQRARSSLKSRYVYTGTTGDRYGIPGSEKLVTGVNRLYADTDGVRLTAIISYTHLSGKDNYPYKGFNEDTWPESDTDEVYCNALWTDGDGGRIGAFTNVVKGAF